MFWRRVLHQVLGLALLLCWTATLEAQLNRGVMEGTVTDPQGAVVPDVAVTITSVDTNVSIPAKTNSSGYYRVGDLVPGKYRAHFEVAGFSSLEITEIEASPGKATKVDAQLKIGESRQLVEVTADVSLLTNNFNAQGGVPLSIGCPGNELTSRCNLIGDPKFQGKRSKDERTNQWINPAAFEPAFGGDENFWANYDPTDDRAWRFGMAGARLPGIRSPGFWNLDAALAKQFKFTESRYCEFRWEVFNALNHQNLGSVNTGWCLPPKADGSTDSVHQGGCQFGRISNIQTDPRAMQFALKFYF